MKVPFICQKCDHEEELALENGIFQKCKCSATMEVYYQDNYEEIAEPNIPCHTCIHNFVGSGEKCNYCSNI